MKRAIGSKTPRKPKRANESETPIASKRAMGTKTPNKAKRATGEKTPIHQKRATPGKTPNLRERAKQDQPQPNRGTSRIGDTMTKTAIKIAIAPQQSGLCALTGAPLDISAPELLDTDRVIERFRGGKYTNDNTRIVTPRAHMERHGILRHRPDWMAELKGQMDSRRQTMKTLMKINNQLLAYQRLTDEPNPEDVEFLTETMDPIKKRLDKIDRAVAKHMKASDHPLVKAALGVASVGPITMAGLTVYVDLEKAQSASALWKYTGLHASSGERYTKGEASGGNKTLRTMVWNMANSMTKNRACPYRDVYDRTKGRLEVSEKIVKSRNNQGQLVEVPWKDTMKSHRHGAALRAVMKHFLADYWFVGREIAGLDARPLYVEERLGHETIIRPRDRGWEW